MRMIIVLAAVMLSLTASGGLFAKDRDRLFCSTGHAPIDTLDMFRLDIFTLSHEDSVALLARLHEQDSIVRFLDSVNRIYPSYEFYKESWDMARIDPYGVKIDSLPDSVLMDCSGFVYPVDGNRVTSSFGMRGGRFHYGVDIGVKYGDTIRATFDGKVRLVSYDRRGYGHYVVVRHGNGLESLMGHMSRVLVRENEEVKAGDPVGLGGSTGRSTGPHLHLEYRFLGNAFDPTKLIDFDSMAVRTEDGGDYLLTLADTYSHKGVLAELSKARYHRVRSGDTLSHIARRYGTSVSALCRLNRISRSSILQIGQRVRYR